MSARRRTLRPALLLAASAAAGLASVPWALAIDSPGAPQADVGSPTRAVSASFTWPASPPADEANAVIYEGGVAGAVEDLGGAPGAVITLPEGELTFRVRAVEVAPDGTRVAESDFVSGAPFVVDRTAPRISPAAPPPSVSEWSTRPVTVFFSCGDALTPIVRCDPVTITGDGRNRSAEGVAVDAAGNEARVSVGGYNIDTAPPTRATPVGPGSLTNVAQPPLTWRPAQDATSGVARYVLVLDGEAVDPDRIERTGDGALRVRPAEPLADGAHEWSVRAVDVAGLVGPPSTASFAIDTTVPAAPRLTGPAGPVAERTPAVGWTSELASSQLEWALVRTPAAAGAAPVRVAGGRTTARSLALPVLTDGDYRLEATQVNAAGTRSASAGLVFSVDTTAPAAPVVTARPLSTGADERPVFRWDGEDGAVSQWQILDRDGDSVQGPTRTGDGEARPAALAPGVYVFQVRQFDAAGNRGALAEARFTVASAISTSRDDAGAPAVDGGTGGGGGLAPTGSAASPAPAPRPRVITAGGTTVLRPATQNARRLRPSAGVGVPSLRPRLTWSGRPRGTTLLNVQVFRMRGRSLTKVHSAFPRGASYRVPGGVLKPGGTYVWRVWPYLGRRGFSERPLGISWFRTRATGLGR